MLLCLIFNDLRWLDLEVLQIKWLLMTDFLLDEKKLLIRWTLWGQHSKKQLALSIIIHMDAT